MHNKTRHYVNLLCRFASIAKLAGEQLGPYIAKLVPKLYRYQYDPNARVRDSMSHIWRALVAEPKKTVDEHFGAILQELLKVPSFISASMLPCMLCGTDMHAKMLSDVEYGVKGSLLSAVLRLSVQLRFVAIRDLCLSEL